MTRPIQPAAAGRTLTLALLIAGCHDAEVVLVHGDPMHQHQGHALIPVSGCHEVKCCGAVLEVCAR